MQKLANTGSVESCSITSTQELMPLLESLTTSPNPQPKAMFHVLGDGLKLISASKRRFILFSTSGHGHRAKGLGLVLKEKD